MHVSHDKPVLPSFALFTILPFPNIHYFPLAFIRKKKSWDSGWRRVEGCRSQLEIRAQKHRRWEWMAADRQVGEQHNAATSPPLLSAAISTSRPPPCQLWILNPKSSKSQGRAAGGKARRRPQVYGHAWLFFVHMLRLPSNVSLQLPLNCSVNFHKPIISQSSQLWPRRGQGSHLSQLQSFIKRCWWSENANEGLKSNQLTRRHSLSEMLFTPKTELLPCKQLLFLRTSLVIRLPEHVPVWFQPPST